MKTGFLLFEQFNGQQNIGSSRIRGHWVCKYMSDAEPFKMAQKYDAIVYQKVYWLEHAKEFGGIKILDICDPDFLQWGHRVKQMADECDAVTCATRPLAEFIAKYTDTPVHVVPDRMDIDEFEGLKKVHVGKAKKAVWFGYSSNYQTLSMSISSLVREGIEELIVIATRRDPYQLPAGFRGKILLTNIPWTAETVNKDILQGDIVINPQFSTGRWRFKSNNKTLTGWALGMPVAHNADELRQFLTEESRIEEGQKRYDEVRKDWDVKQSADEMTKIITEVYANHTS